MTEKEKILAGQLYDYSDKELLTEWHRARDLARDYNNTDPSNKEEKERILNLLLGGRGENLWTTAPFYVDYGSNIYFGDNCEVNMNYTPLDDNKIVIGNNALIAPNVQIYAAFHPTDTTRRFGGPKEDSSFEFCKMQTLPVMIGNNVWIGGGVIVMPDVTIGNHVVIGAGGVATKDIPDNMIACGNPCRAVRGNRQRTLMVRDGVHRKTAYPGRTRSRSGAPCAAKAGGNSVCSSILNSARSSIRNSAQLSVPIIYSVVPVASSAFCSAFRSAIYSSYACQTRIASCSIWS